VADTLLEGVEAYPALERAKIARVDQVGVSASLREWRVSTWQAGPSSRLMV
jgi:hypothetical protein